MLTRRALIIPRSLTLAVFIVLLPCALSHGSLAQPNSPNHDAPSPEAIRQLGPKIQQQNADALRKTLKKFGYKDEGLQNAVVDYTQKRDEARLPLQMATQQLARRG